MTLSGCCPLTEEVGEGGWSGDVLGVFSICVLCAGSIAAFVVEVVDPF